MHEALGSNPSITETHLASQNWEGDGGESGIQGHLRLHKLVQGQPQLYGELEASLD